MVDTPAQQLELRRPALKETLPTILDLAPVALRHPRERAKFVLAAASTADFRKALDRLGFTEISTCGVKKLWPGGARGCGRVT